MISLINFLRLIEIKKKIMKLKCLIIIGIFLSHISKVNSQIDHLQPIQGIFGSYDYQVEYYSTVRKYLYEGLEERPSFRLIVLPSFTEEYLITTKEKDGKIILLMRKAKKNIWYASQKDKSKKIKIKNFEIEIDSITKDIFFSVFNYALDETKYEESDIVMNDGINYIFQTAEYGQDKKIGHVWSPKDKTKMGQLVNIVENLALYLQEKKIKHLNKAKRDAIKLIDEFEKNKN